MTKYLLISFTCLITVSFWLAFEYPHDKPQVRFKLSPALRADDSTSKEDFDVQKWLEDKRKETNTILLKQEALDSEYAKLWQTDI